ncbi:MAG TPA: DUF3482 domain-containing protein [Thermoanaerobaculia bacterium]|nr:DUF3482 domain-containing protein [Thermoanaerobaculia bacterium]
MRQSGSPASGRATAGGDRASRSVGDRKITLSLVSHTNVGKTTLARTLLRRDVGEVLDQAHVTEESERFQLLAVPEGELVLWDTPGFGDSRRLLARLEKRDRPIVWFLQQTWDRIADRPLWSSQQAVLNVQEEADVVLYLVNAAEEPEEAGYLAPELDLLTWVGKPLLLLLNQTGGAGASPLLMAERLEVWRRATARWEIVRDVYALDAFSRGWVQEGLLFERVERVLDPSERPLMAKLRRAWEDRNLEVLARSVEAMARYLAAAAGDREELPDRRPTKAQKRRAMRALAERLQASTQELMAVLLSAHGLAGASAGEVERQVDAYVVQGELKVDPERGALLGGVVSGALGGLAADVLAGGLTFGGGMIAGAILGALGGAGLARGFELAQGSRRPAVRWGAPFLDRLAAETLVRYLAVAHFGRGRGAYQDAARPPARQVERWRSRVQGELRLHEEEMRGVWRELGRAEDPDAAGPQTARRLRAPLTAAARAALLADYPEAYELLRREG